jgi:hypothetical protein
VSGISNGALAAVPPERPFSTKTTTPTIVVMTRINSRLNDRTFTKRVFTGFRQTYKAGEHVRKHSGETI